jgi:hypothetical protein
MNNYKYNGKTYSTLVDMCKAILQGYDMTNLISDEIKFKDLGFTEEDLEEYNDLIIKINKYYNSSSLTLDSTITDIGIK